MRDWILSKLMGPRPTPAQGPGFPLFLKAARDSDKRTPASSQLRTSQGTVYCSMQTSKVSLTAVPHARPYMYSHGMNSPAHTTAPRGPTRASTACSTTARPHLRVRTPAPACCRTRTNDTTLRRCARVCVRGRTSAARAVVVPQGRTLPLSPCASEIHHTFARTSISLRCPCEPATSSR